jgi:hypothetical protein
MSDNTDPRMAQHVEMARHLKRGCLMRRAAYYSDIAGSWAKELEHMQMLVTYYLEQAAHAEDGDCDDS